MKLIKIILFKICSSAEIYGLGYNAKHANGDCPNFDKVLSDYKTILSVTDRIRTFGLADCNQGEMLIQASQATGMKLSLGMFINQFQPEFDREFGLLKDLISKYKGAFESNVENIIVGSESMYRNETTHEQVGGLIKQVKDYVVSQGLSTSVTTSDTKDMWYTSDVTNNSDNMFVNAYPYWEGIPIEQGVEHLFQKVNEVKTRVPGKRFILGETGWPEGGSSFGASIPSKENQLKFFNQFVCRAKAEGLEYFWFSAFDEDWKPTELKFAWGIFDKDSKLKEGYKFPVQC